MTYVELFFIHIDIIITFVEMFYTFTYIVYVHVHFHAFTRDIQKVSYKHLLI